MAKIIFSAYFLCLMLCGCFWNSDYSAPRTFDLDPGGKTAVMLPCQVSFAIIRNISGADRRFFERHAGNRMVSDEFNRSLYTTKPAQAQGSRLPAMRHRSLNNFYKKWDNNE